MRQDQHALRVYEPAQFHFPFDVQHLALAETAAGGDARLSAEAEAPQADHRQAIYLSDMLVIGLDQDRAAPYLLLYAFPQAVRTIYSGVDRALHIRGCYRGVLLPLPRPIGALVLQIDDGAHVR